MPLNLSRNTRLFVSTSKTQHDTSNTFEIPIQEDYTLDQGVDTTTVSAEEAGPTPRRGGKTFNTTLQPVDWAFTTYLNPYSLVDEAATPNSYKMCVDMLLWHAIASSKATPVSLTDGQWDSTASPDGTAKVFGNSTQFRVGFENNSAHVLTEIFFYFKIDNDVFLVEGAQIGQAEISVDISDIAQVAWSGNALKKTKLTVPPAFISSNGGSYDESSPTIDSYVAIPSNKTYLVNKLTTVKFQSDVSGSNLFYSIPPTSASVTINNNITYLTPSTLAEVDEPIGSFTGAFEVSGTLEAYLNDTGNNGSTRLLAKGTTELLEDMLGNMNKVTNTSDVTIYLGGEGSGDPQVRIKMPTVHISIPTLSVEDVVSTSIEFQAQTTSTELLSGDELVIEMTDTAP